MNKRIQELYIKTLSEECSNPALVDIEKFAGLIVKEYEKLLPEICPWGDADKEGPMKGWHVQFVARKHFGVES